MPSAPTKAVAVLGGLMSGAVGGLAADIAAGGLTLGGGMLVGGVLGGPLSAKARPSTLTLLFAALLASVAAVTLVETLLL